MMNYKEVEEFLARENHLSEIEFNRWTKDYISFYRFTKLGFLPISKYKEEKKPHKYTLFIAGVFVGAMTGLVIIACAYLL